MTEPTFELVIQGFPGSSPSNGGMGWSSIGLVRTADRVVLLDTGPYGVRDLLRRRLAERGIAPEQVTDVVLTHAHHDHSVNWPMFTAAEVHISAAEFAWSVTVQPGIGPVAEFAMRELARSGCARPVIGEEDIVPGVRLVPVPGHTPGSSMIEVRTREELVLFAGDAVKNRAELVSGVAESAADLAESHRSIAAVGQRMRAVPDAVLVPGHDLPMRFRDGLLVVEGEREAQVEVRFGDDLADRRLFHLNDSAS